MRKTVRTTKNREQYLREVSIKRARLLAKKAKREERQELLAKTALGLAGVGVLYLFIGTIGLAVIGAITLVKGYVKSLD